MTDEDINELSEKIHHGLRLAEYRILKEKALHDEDIVVCDKANNIVYIPAKWHLQSWSKTLHMQPSLIRLNGSFLNFK